MEAPKRWVNLLATIGRPAFTRNHDKPITALGQGLAEASGGELVSQTSGSYGASVSGEPASPGASISLLSYLNAASISRRRPTAMRGSAIETNPEASMAIVEVTLVPPATGSTR